MIKDLSYRLISLTQKLMSLDSSKISSRNKTIIDGILEEDIPELQRLLKSRRDDVKDRDIEGRDRDIDRNIKDGNRDRDIENNTGQRDISGDIVQDETAPA